MELNEVPPVARVRARETCRLIASRFPSTGILDRVASPGDLPYIFELESWTNDRISAELGLLHRIPPGEWVTGKPMSSVVMAAFCHTREGGGRFNGPDRGAWYAAIELETAHAEVVYHRSRELAEVGVFEARLEMRLFRANFDAEMHDLRDFLHGNSPVFDPVSYTASQQLGRTLLVSGSNGVVYPSVRRPAGTCIACFRPKLVLNVRAAGHFEYRWEGRAKPVIRRIE